jgi:hypothetical protein
VNNAITKWLPWLVLGAVLAGFTAVAYERIPEDSHSPLLWLFAPGLIGEMLVGGVHGGAQESTQEIAWSISNGLFWTAVLRVVFALTVATKAILGKESPKKAN